jgi:regulator of protease activity HflC (stomatin/prohibitin superfamily)
MSALLIACLAFCAALALVLAGLRRVPESEAWVVQRFGRYARTLRPGWRYVWPLLERVSQHVALIGHRIDLPLHARGATSATGQRATLYYQILEPERSGSAGLPRACCRNGTVPTTSPRSAILSRCLACTCWTL